MPRETGNRPAVARDSPHDKEVIAVTKARHRKAKGDCQEKQQKNKKKILTPDEWADKQLEKAPPRGREWAERLARIYGYELED